MKPADDWLCPVTRARCGYIGAIALIELVSDRVMTWMFGVSDKRGVSWLLAKRGKSMARRVFFSFHYQRDIWRVNQIRSMPNITGCAAARFPDYPSLWEETKKRGDNQIKRLIDRGLDNTSVTVVFIGAKTAGAKIH